MPAEFEMRVAAVPVAREMSVIVALAITAPVLGGEPLYEAAVDCCLRHPAAASQRY